MSYICYSVFHNSQHQSWRVREDGGLWRSVLRTTQSLPLSTAS